MFKLVKFDTPDSHKEWRRDREACRTEPLLELEPKALKRLFFTSAAAFSGILLPDALR